MYYFCLILQTWNFIHSTKPKGFDELTKWFKTSANGLVIGSQGASNIYPIIPTKELPVLGEGLLYAGGVYRRLLLLDLSSLEGGFYVENISNKLECLTAEKSAVLLVADFYSKLSKMITDAAIILKWC